MSKVLCAVVAAALASAGLAAQCPDLVFSTVDNANNYDDAVAPHCDGVWGAGVDTCQDIPDWQYDPEATKTTLSPILNAELSGVGKAWEGVTLVDTLRVYFWNPEEEPSATLTKYTFVNATFETDGHGSAGDEVEGQYHLNAGFGDAYVSTCASAPTGDAADCIANGGDRRSCCGAVAQDIANNEYHDARCYKLRYVEVSMGAFSSGQRVSFFSDSGFNAFRGILTVYNKHPLTGLRGESVGDYLAKSEMPFVIKYKQQVVASLTPDASVYDNANVFLQLKQQEVVIDVNQIDTTTGSVGTAGVTATIKLATNLQYPFKAFSDSAVDALNCQGLGVNGHKIACFGNAGRPQGARAYMRKITTQGGVEETAGPWGPSIFSDSQTADIVVVQDCADPNVGETFIQGGTGAPGGADSCTQTWTMTFKPPTSGFCELDGWYRLYIKFGCQPLFEGEHDCPLNPDDQGQPDNWKPIDFYLDSESWCAELAASVEATASLEIYKEPSHQTVATNFIENQLAYFVLTTQSSQTTITSTTINRISIRRASDAGAFVDVFVRDNSVAVDTNISPYDPPSCQVDDGSSRGSAESTSSGVLNPQSDRCEVEGLYLFDGPSELEGGAVVGAKPAEESHFEWKLSAAAFPVGTDAVVDFDVRVDAFVAFKDVQYSPADQASNPLLQVSQAGLLGATNLVALTKISMNPSAIEAETTSAIADEETSSSMAAIPSLFMVLAGLACSA